MESPSRILLMTQTLGTGGCARDVSNIARNLDRAHFEPHVGCFSSEGIRGDDLRSAGVPIIEFPVRSFCSPSIIVNILRMGSYLLSHNIRLVHAFDTSTNVFAIATGRIFMTPVITANLWYRFMVPPLYRRTLRVTDRLSNVIIVNSDAVRRHLIEDENTPPGSIRVCHNGVDPEQFAPRPLVPRPAVATLTVGTVCALRAEKCIDLLLKAFAAVRRLHPSMKLLIVGSGEMLTTLQDVKNRLGLGEDCDFEPEKRDVADWMRAIDVFVVPSSSESFPNALLEAMSCGCCVIASRVGGIPELVSHGRNGLLFEAGDLDGLTRALTTVTFDKSLRDRLGQEASRTAHENFSIQIAARRMEEIYDSVLTGRL